MHDVVRVVDLRSASPGQSGGWSPLVRCQVQHWRAGGERGGGRVVRGEKGGGRLPVRLGRGWWSKGHAALRSPLLQHHLGCTTTRTHASADTIPLLRLSARPTQLQFHELHVPLVVVRWMREGGGCLEARRWDKSARKSNRERVRAHRCMWVVSWCTGTALRAAEGCAARMRPF